MVQPNEGTPGTATQILVVLSAEQFCIANCKGDSTCKPDASGRVTLSWNRYPDLGKSLLGMQHNHTDRS